MAIAGGRQERNIDTLTIQEFYTLTASLRTSVRSAPGKSSKVREKANNLLVAIDKVLNEFQSAIDKGLLFHAYNLQAKPAGARLLDTVKLKKDEDLLKFYQLIYKNISSLADLENPIRKTDQELADVFKEYAPLVALFKENIPAFTELSKILLSIISHLETIQKSQKIYEKIFKKLNGAISKFFEYISNEKLLTSPIFQNDLDVLKKTLDVFKNLTDSQYLSKTLDALKIMWYLIDFFGNQMKTETEGFDRVQVIADKRKQIEKAQAKSPSLIESHQDPQLEYWQAQYLRGNLFPPFVGHLQGQSIDRELLSTVPIVGKVGAAQ